MLGLVLIQVSEAVAHEKVARACLSPACGELLLLAQGSSWANHGDRDSAGAFCLGALERFFDLVSAFPDAMEVEGEDTGQGAGASALAIGRSCQSPPTPASLSGAAEAKERRGGEPGGGALP